MIQSMRLIRFQFHRGVSRRHAARRWRRSALAMAIGLLGIAQVPMSAGFTIVGALRGAGDTRAVLNMTLISVWGVRLIGTWFAVQVLHLGLMGAWLVMALDWCTRAAVALVRWKSGHWKHRKV